MKKISKILLTTTLLFLTFVGSFSASELLEKDKEPFYVNSLGVSMTEEEYNNLLRGFHPDTIDSMPQATVDMFKNDEKLKSESSTTYIRIDTDFDKNGKVISEKETEITKEEYEEAEELEKRGITSIKRVSGSSGSPTHTTSHKKITISVGIGGGSEVKIITLTNQWLQNPSVRSYDVLAVRSATLGSIIRTDGHLFGYQKYTDENGNQQTINYDHNSGWVISGTRQIGTNLYLTSYGARLSHNLKNTGTNISNSITVIMSNGSFPFTAYGAYEHATSTVSLSQSQNYTISASGKGGVINFANSVMNLYDDTKGVEFTYGF